MTTTKTSTVSRTDLAVILGTTPDRISKYIAEGMPVVSTGSGRGHKTMLDLPQCVAWLIARRMASHGPEGQPDPQRERALLDQARREELALKILARRGELIEVAEVEREFQHCASTVKSRMRRIPDAVADRLLSAGGPAQIKALLLADIDGALLELSRLAEPGEDGGEQ